VTGGDGVKPLDHVRLRIDVEQREPAAQDPPRQTGQARLLPEIHHMQPSRR
jgi:hypothetical protein